LIQIMKNKLAKVNLRDVHALPALTTRERVDALRYEHSLGDFIKAAWHHAGEPQSFQSNWHIDCVTDHLMAVARREIHGPGPLIFTLPPRHMKSRGVNVFFPAWTWAQNPDPNKQGHGLAVRPGTMMGPGVKFAYISYIQRLSNEHSLAYIVMVIKDPRRHRTLLSRRGLAPLCYLCRRNGPIPLSWKPPCRSVAGW
jgi:hypothetical protein